MDWSLGMLGTTAQGPPWQTSSPPASMSGSYLIGLLPGSTDRLPKSVSSSRRLGLNDISIEESPCNAWVRIIEEKDTPSSHSSEELFDHPVLVANSGSIRESESYL
jgi:hypothetical protein